MQAFKVKEMSCGGCVCRITQAVRVIDADARVEADIAAAQVRVDSDADAAELARAIIDAGYPASPIAQES